MHTQFFTTVMPDLRTFTCFPKLPLEIQIKIWEEAANLPRNLDIWAHTTGEISYPDPIGNGRRYTESTFKYITRQPVPGVLLATKQSRAATTKYFHLSFGSEKGFPGGVNIITPPRILRNSGADRICPMGPCDEYSDTWMCGQEAPPSCAVNVYRPSPHDYDPLDRLMFCADDFHDEFLLYYCEKPVSISGPFDFVDISDGYATFREWKALSEGKAKLTQDYDDEVANRRASIVREHEEKGLEPPTEGELDLGWHMPEIKFVALVINGVRY